MAGRIDLGGGDELAETHEINVTPMIDVILVLLIIFMVAAPLATVDMPVNLPASSARAQPRPERPVFLTVRADLGLAIGDTLVARDGIGEALHRATENRPEETIFLRADRSVSYGDLMEVMNLLRRAGYLRIALVGLEAATSP